MDQILLFISIIAVFILLIIVSEVRASRKHARKYSREEMILFREETTYFSKSEFYDKWKHQLTEEELIQKWFDENS